MPEVRTLREWAIELDAAPGGGADGDAAVDPGRDADVTLLELARTVQLKGLCTPERAAASLAVAEARIVELLDGNESHFQSTARGVALSVEGREWVAARLAEERDAIDTAALETSYGAFMTLNHRFKELVSNWQLSSMDGHSDEDWATLVEAVGELHAGLVPVLEQTAGQLARLGGYRGRFDRALAEMRGGDTSMLASPMKESYHTVWFEYHEELIELGGRDRGADERSEGG